MAGISPCLDMSISVQSGQSYSWLTAICSRSGISLNASVSFACSIKCTFSRRQREVPTWRVRYLSASSHSKLIPAFVFVRVTLSPCSEPRNKSSLTKRSLTTFSGHVSANVSFLPTACISPTNSGCELSRIYASPGDGQPLTAVSFEEETSTYRLSSDLDRAIQDVSSWRVDTQFLRRFPDLAGDVLPANYTHMTTLMPKFGQRDALQGNKSTEQDRMQEHKPSQTPGWAGFGCPLILQQHTRIMSMEDALGTDMWPLGG